MDGFQIILAIEGFHEKEIITWDQTLNSYGVAVKNIYIAKSKNEIIEILFTYGDINVIIVSEQLNGYISTNDLNLFNKANNKIIIPILNGNKKGKAEYIENYFKNNFYNILFDNDEIINEIGKILIFGRTVKAAMIYTGLDMESIKNRIRQEDITEEYHEKDTDVLKFEIPKPNRMKQPVFADNSILLGFCGSDIHYECTITAIAAANYIASAGYRVSLIEPDFSKGVILDQLIAELEDKEMISCNNVDYYPEWDLTNHIYSTDVVIFDLSSMHSEESHILNKMNRIFLCSDIESGSISGADKLQNNDSFKYSILFRKKLMQDLSYINGVIDVFTDCSAELKRLLKMALLSRGFDLSKVSDEDVLNRLNELNTLNKSGIGGQADGEMLPERKIREDSDYVVPAVQMNPIPEKIPAQVLKKADVHKVPAAENRKEEKILNQEKYQKKNDPEFLQNFNQVSNRQDILPEQPVIKDENYNYNVKDNGYNQKLKEDPDIIPESFSKDNNKYKDAESKQMTAQFKKDERKSILSQWFTANKEEEDNEIDSKDLTKESFDNHEDNSGLIYNNSDYIEGNKSKLKKKLLSNQVLCGKETIFITGLKHGCGCSHSGISFARYILEAYSENICICHKKGAYDLEDENITEYTKDTDYDSIFTTNRFIIYDCGVLGELNEEQLKELKRCNIKIMICSGDEKYLGNLSRFIRELGNSANEWIFAFNLVTSRDKEYMIRKIMDGYKICFIPLHDCDNPNKKVSKMWDLVLKRNLL